jgi:hypothetical protein
MTTTPKLTPDDITEPAVNGDALLDDVRAFLTRYCAFPSPEAEVAVTLWAAHTHLVELFESTPRLAFLSPVKQCGKTRALECLNHICAGAETLSDASASYMFRRLGAGNVTVLLDEADAIWKRGKSDETAEALRSIVNAGHRKAATVGRVQMNGKTAQLERFRVYAPVALAGIGDCLPDTVTDRSAVVRMRRRAPNERVAEYRERTTRPEGEQLRDRLAAWATTVADGVGDPWPTMPPGVTDRPADVWEPLLAVAELAGGDWPAQARAACVSFTSNRSPDDEAVGVRLLADLYDIFHARGDLAVAMSTEDVLGKLHALDEAPWGDWYGRPLTARDLAKQLKPFGIRSHTVRIGETTPKGFRSADLMDAWRRYDVLGGGSATSDTSATVLTSDVSHVADVAELVPNCRWCGASDHNIADDCPEVF